MAKVKSYLGAVGAKDEEPIFGELLHRLRREAGLSQDALAKRSGISVRALRELERGRARGAQRRSAEVLADALGLAGVDRAEFLSLAQEGRRRGVQAPASGSVEPLPLPHDLVGRETEVARLEELIRGNSTLAIVGQPGVGKTVIAAYATQRLRDRFPDGCFAVDLRGVDENPMTVHSVFDRLLRALGVPPGDIPPTEAEQSGMYRAVLASRKVLVVLDNAADESQVRPLLTTAPGCRTLVTCRRTLAGLEGVRWLHLGPLPDSDAEALVAAIVGEDRARAEPGEVRELVALCGNLPLALRIVGNRLVTRPHWSLAFLVKQLHDERERLTTMSVGDLQVRSAFEMSDRRLSPGGRMLFRRLAVIPGTDFGMELVRVAADLTEMEAFTLLDELVDAGLVLAGPVPGRFRFHDLLRIFARERWEDEDEYDHTDRDAVTAVVLHYVLDRASAAASLFSPEGVQSDVFGSVNEACAWLDQESSGWLAAVREAARLGWHRETLALARSMHWYSDGNWLAAPWAEIFQLGVEAALALGDRSAEAQQRNFVGWAHYVLRNDTTALEEHLLAMRLAAEAGDQLELAWARAYAGTLQIELGEREEGLELIRQAAELSTRFDFWTVELSLRYRLGRVLLLLGDLQEALAVQEALIEELARRKSEQEEFVSRGRSAAIVRKGAALCLHAMQRWEEAASMFAEARRMQSEGGAVLDAAEAALWEGRCRIAAGDYQQASVALGYALDVFDENLNSAGYAEARAELSRLPAS